MISRPDTLELAGWTIEHVTALDYEWWIVQDLATKTTLYSSDQKADVNAFVRAYADNAEVEAKWEENR